MFLRLRVNPTRRLATSQTSIPVDQPATGSEHEQMSQAGSQAGCASSERIGRIPKTCRVPIGPSNDRNRTSVAKQGPEQDPCGARRNSHRVAWLAFGGWSTGTWQQLEEMATSVGAT